MEALLIINVGFEFVGEAVAAAERGDPLGHRRRGLHGVHRQRQERGYPPCKTGDNIDLNNWTLQELKEVIASFKRQIVQQNTEVLSSRISREFMKSKIFDKPREEVVKYEGTQLWDYAVKEEQECEKSPTSVKVPEGLKPAVKIEK